MIISKFVITGIEDRLKRIQDNPSYFSERALILETDLRKEADLHSFWIEHPEMRQKLLLENNVTTEQEIKKIAKKGIERIKDA